MGISAVSTQQGITQTRELENKPKAQEQKEVSFWSKDWTAGNFVREKIGWEGLADWLDDKDKVCTDGKDDGKLGFGETMESFGKGLAGLVKGAMNHPIATAVSFGVGAAVVALTSGAILPVMVAAGATIGAGMIGVGAYKAATADTDAEAKQAWETIGTGTFTVGASALGAKSALKQANAAGVKNAIATNNPIKNVVNCFKSSPRAIKVSSWHIASKSTITSIHNGVNEQIKELIAKNEMTPELKAKIKEFKNYETEMVKGVKRSIKNGQFVDCKLNQYNDWVINKSGNLSRTNCDFEYPYQYLEWLFPTRSPEQSLIRVANYYKSI